MLSDIFGWWVHPSKEATNKSLLPYCLPPHGEDSNPARGECDSQRNWKSRSS